MPNLLTVSEATISSRSRNLGYGWTQQPVRKFNPNGTDYLGFDPVCCPDVEGGLRTVETAAQRAAKINNSNDWRADLFVGGRRVEAVWGDHIECTGEESHVDYWGNERRTPIYTSRGETWLRCTAYNLISRLRSGETLRVRLAE